MVGVVTLIVNIDLMTDHITHSTHFHLEEKGDVNKSEVTIQKLEKGRAHLPRNIDGVSASFISHLDKSQNFTLTELSILFLELVGNVSNFAGVDSLEQTTCVHKSILIKWDSHVDSLFFVLVIGHLFQNIQI
jgi:hypothetical protein